MADTFICSKGVPLTLSDQISAPAASKQFCVTGPHSEVTVQLSYSDAPSALSGNIESSHDGGTVWRILAAFDLIATKIFSFQAVVGPLYRLNVTTVTDGPTSIIAFAG